MKYSSLKCQRPVMFTFCSLSQTNSIVPLMCLTGDVMSDMFCWSTPSESSMITFPLSVTSHSKFPVENKISCHQLCTFWIKKLVADDPDSWSMLWGETHLKTYWQLADLMGKGQGKNKQKNNLNSLAARHNRQHRSKSETGECVRGWTMIAHVIGIAHDDND